MILSRWSLEIVFHITEIIFQNKYIKLEAGSPPGVVRGCQYTLSLSVTFVFTQSEDSTSTRTSPLNSTAGLSLHKGSDLSQYCPSLPHQDEISCLLNSIEMGRSGESPWPVRGSAMMLWWKDVSNYTGFTIVSSTQLVKQRKLTFLSRLSSNITTWKYFIQNSYIYIYIFHMVHRTYQ